MSDLVEKLRRYGRGDDGYRQVFNSILLKAADEIERLQRANEEQRESLKVAYDEIADKNLRIVNIRAVLDHETFFVTDVQSEKPPNFREMRGIFKDSTK